MGVTGGHHRGAPKKGTATPATLLIAAVLTIVVVVTGIASGAFGLLGGDPGVDTSAHDIPSSDAWQQTADQQAYVASAAPSVSASPQKIVRGVTVEHLSREEISRTRARVASQLASESQSTTPSGGPVDLTIGTMNVLGSQHTGPHGDQHRGWPAASWRSQQLVTYFRAHGVDVVGLQEAQPDQLDALMSATGFKAYPGYEFGSNNTDNSVLYDPDRFEFVSGTSFTITFMSGPRPQTVLRLRDKATGREFYVVNMHTSAGHDAHDTATRHAGMATAVGYLNNLKQQGLPIFVTGDMNDREEFRSRVLRPTGFEAPVDGAWHAGVGGAGSGRMPVDWIASTQGVDWSDYWLDEGTENRHISDHFFVTAQATIPAA